MARQSRGVCTNNAGPDALAYPHPHEARQDKDLHHSSCAPCQAQHSLVDTTHAQLGCQPMSLVLAWLLLELLLELRTLM